MKTLVAYYSRTGVTKLIANKIAKLLKADLDKVIDQKNRQGLAGWISGGKDAATAQITKITHDKNSDKYDLVIIGTPVWVGDITPAIRTYLSQNKFKKVAFFCTCGDKKSKTFQSMKTLSKKPIATLEVRTKHKDTKYTRDKIRKFCRSLK